MPVVQRILDFRSTVQHLKKHQLEVTTSTTLQVLLLATDTGNFSCAKNKCAQENNRAATLRDEHEEDYETQLQNKALAQSRCSCRIIKFSLVFDYSPPLKVDWAEI